MSEKYGHRIRVRMGINSGIVTAGNMGSEKKFQYTVMGDVVNTAARLEPVNKDFGTKIIVGEATYSMVRDFFVFRPLIKILVKGKSIPVLIYELICRREESSAETDRLVAGYTEAMGLFCTRSWDEAEAGIKRILALKPQDGPSIYPSKLIAKFRHNPPPDGWQGEYMRSEKN